jgi:hypothetical protein
MTYTGFRLTGRNAVLLRPADKPQDVAGATWARDRSAVGADDGTELDATWVNRLRANLENLVTGLGGNLADGDDQLVNAVVAYVEAEVAALLDAAPGALDTLNELAAALGDDANFAATVTAALAGKQSADADLTALAALASVGIAVRTGGNTWAQRQIQGTANEIAVGAGDGALGNPTISLPAAMTMTGKTLTGGTYHNPALTGTPTAPTAGPGTATDQIATTAFVNASAAGGVSSDALFAARGAGGPRLLATNLALASRDRFGMTGPGNGAFLPKTVTASQTGTTVTLSTAILNPDHVGCLIEWSSGEEAIVTAVDTSGAGYANITTCTVDRSQTVSSGTATINARSLVHVVFGNSVSHPVERYNIARRYRALGYGGYIYSAGNSDINGLGLASETFAGGAAISATTDAYNTLPWSRCFSLPAAGSVAFGQGSNYGTGTYRDLPVGMQTDEMTTDTFTFTWRRGAGALTVERRRFMDVGWTTIDTIADTNAGSTAFVTRKYKHTLGYGWEYRIASTSGTVKVVQAALLNRTTPGYVPWTLHTSSNDIANFLLLPQADFTEIVRQTGVDLVTFHHIMSRTGAVAADYTADLMAFRALWKTAAGARPLDILWVSPWEPNNSVEAQAETKAYGDAIRNLAVFYNEPYLSLEAAWGDYATQSWPLGLLGDAVHPTNIRGAGVAAHLIETVMGLVGHAQAREARPINARIVEADTMRVRGIDVATALDAARRHAVVGAMWNSNDMRLVGNTAMGADIGTGDFTFAIELDVIANVSGGTQTLAVINSDPFDVTSAGTLLLDQEERSLRLQLRGSPNSNNTTYRWFYFGAAYGGRRGWLVIRSDRANNRFDIFFEGRLATALVPNSTIVAGSGAPISSWSGSGRHVTVQQGNSLARTSNVYGVMAWRTRLSDAEIVANVHAVRPATTPDFQWVLDAGIGRVVRDASGNNRPALFRWTSVNEYALPVEPTWGQRRSGLAVPWVATAEATTTLVAGDDMICRQALARDWLLPAVPQIGDRVRVSRGIASGGNMQFSQPALHQIKTGVGTTVGTDATTIGTGGKLRIVQSFGSAELRCVRAEAGVAYEWALVASAGTLTWI